MTPKKVLILNDSFFRSPIYEETFGGRPECELVFVSSAAGAVEVLEHEQNIDLVVIDKFMPRLLSAWFLERKNANGRRSLPVILYGGKGNRDDSFLVRAVKERDFMVPAWETDRLKEAVENIHT